MRRFRWIVVVVVVGPLGCDPGNGPRTYPPLILSAVSTGGSHTCGLDAQGAAHCWGVNSNGELGVPVGSVPPCPPAQSTHCSPLSQTVTGPERFSALSAGPGTIGTETCGLTTTQRAYCWGTRYYADIVIWRADQPDSVPTSLTFGELESGVSHLCGIATGGAVHCLGSNYAGELGAGLTWTQLEYADTFVAASGGITFRSIAVGVNYACGLDGGGAAWCWGDNTYGQLGAGDTTQQYCGFFHNLRCVHAPVAVSGGLAYRWLTAGRNHTCGLTTGGTLYCWGANGASQLGTTAALPTCPGVPISRPPQPCATTPRVVSFPGGTQPPLSAAVAGGAHTCAISVDGDLYCWGSDQHGQLGLGGSPQACAGPLACRMQPTLVTGTYFFAVSAGYEHTCAITAADEAYCWGANDRGQLGDGTFLDRSRPAAVRRLT